ncbi:hypothetical protein STEG23_024528, partial [Scotinomys teguina]
TPYTFNSVIIVLPKTTEEQSLTAFSFICDGAREEIDNEWGKVTVLAHDIIDRTWYSSAKSNAINGVLLEVRNGKNQFSVNIISDRINAFYLRSPWSHGGLSLDSMASGKVKNSFSVRKYRDQRITEVMDPRKESPTITLLDQHDSLLHSRASPSTTDKCNSHPLSKKPLFTADGEHHRKPQLDTRQRSTDCEEPSSNGYIYITTPTSMDQGTLKKIIRARKSAVK